MAERTAVAAGPAMAQLEALITPGALKIVSKFMINN
jgi:hypothetical protein